MRSPLIEVGLNKNEVRGVEPARDVADVGQTGESVPVVAHCLWNHGDDRAA